MKSAWTLSALVWALCMLAVPAAAYAVELPPTDSGYPATALLGSQSNTRYQQLEFAASNQLPTSVFPRSQYRIYYTFPGLDDYVEINRNTTPTGILAFSADSTAVRASLNYLIAGTDYEVRICAFNADRTRSHCSNAMSGRTMGTAPRPLNACPALDADGTLPFTGRVSSVSATASNLSFSGNPWTVRDLRASNYATYQCDATDAHCCPLTTASTPGARIGGDPRLGSFSVSASLLIPGSAYRFRVCAARADSLLCAAAVPLTTPGAAPGYPAVEPLGETTITASPAVRTAETSARFEFSSSEPGNAFECSLDGGDYAECDSPHGVTDLSVGQHTFAVRSVNDSGDTDSTPATRAWEIVAPVGETTIVSHPPATGYSPDALFEFRSSVASNTFECSLDDGAFEDCASPYAAEGLSLGAHTFEVRAVNALGDAEAEPASHSWEIAREPVSGGGSENYNSAIGTNLNWFNYYSTEWQTKDLMKRSGGWITRCQGSCTEAVCPATSTPSFISNTGEASKLNLDENGWIRSIPAVSDPNNCYNAVSTIISQGGGGHFPRGQHVVLYEGEGSISYSGATVVSRAAGRDVVDVSPSSGSFSIVLNSVNPSNYLRNIRVVAPGGICGDDPASFYSNEAEAMADGCGDFRSNEETLADHPYHGLYLERLKRYKTLRFMQPLQTNQNIDALRAWSQRPKITDARWSDPVRGIPLEVAYGISNEAGADAWVNMPARADDDYMRNAAALAKSTLKPGLKVYVEYVNEVWNGVMPYRMAADYARDQGLALFGSGTNPGAARQNWFGLRSQQMCRIWKDVFADDPSRVVCVMGGFVGNAWSNEQALGCPLWVAHPSNTARENCAADMDTLSIAPYFGGYLGNESNEAAVQSWTTDADGGLNRLFRELLSGGELPGGPAGGALNSVAGNMRAQKAVADRFGVSLTAYEGGNHLIRVGRVMNNEPIRVLFERASRDPRMGDVYMRHFLDWKAAGGELYAYYTSVSLSTNQGSVGALEYQDEPLAQAYKYNAIMDFMDENPCWWEGCESQAPTPPDGGDDDETPPDDGPGVDYTTVSTVPALIDLRPQDTYKGFQGGLYPDGSNEMPASHLEAGLEAAADIRPLDTEGREDPVNGRIVLLSMGMSNTTQEFGSSISGAVGAQDFRYDGFMGASDAAARDSSAANDPNFPYLELVDGAASMRTADHWYRSQNNGRDFRDNYPNDPLINSEYDRVREQVLAAQGLSEEQVQVIWLKVANPLWNNPNSTPSSPPTLPAANSQAYTLERQMGQIIREAALHYPNLKMVFVSSRIYGGYATTPLNPEPYAFEYGFSVKWLIESQIEQMETGTVDPIAGDLDYSDGTAPYIAWGPYLWANGLNPRSDGLTWRREDFQSDDGTHPARTVSASNPLGRQKVANMLFNFFSTSPVTKCWFLASGECGE